MWAIQCTNGDFYTVRTIYHINHHCIPYTIALFKTRKQARDFKASEIDSLVRDLFTVVKVEIKSCGH